MRTRMLLVFLCACVTAQAQTVIYENSVRVPYGDFRTETAYQRDACMVWWREAKFGMVVHWGLYSALGGMWKGEYVKKRGREWIQCGTKLDSETYRNAAVPGMTPTPDFAGKLADLALPHPFAVRPAPHGPRDHAVYRKYLYDQVHELMSGYGTIDILWWDFSPGNSQGDFRGAKDLVALIREKQPNIISNNRLYRVHDPKTGRNARGEYAFYTPNHGDFTTPEQKVPRLPLSNLDWETCMTHNDSWGYNLKRIGTSRALGRCWRSSAAWWARGELSVQRGSRRDGSVPEETVRLMHEIGAWLKVNGEAIYRTRASPIIDCGSDLPNPLCSVIKLVLKP